MDHLGRPLSLGEKGANFPFHMKQFYCADFAFTGPAARVEGTRT